MGFFFSSLFRLTWWATSCLVLSTRQTKTPSKSDSVHSPLKVNKQFLLGLVFFPGHLRVGSQYKFKAGGYLVVGVVLLFLLNWFFIFFSSGFQSGCRRFARRSSLFVWMSSGRTSAQSRRADRLRARQRFRHFQGTTSATRVGGRQAFQR